MIPNRIFERIGIVIAVDGRNIKTFKVSNEETTGCESMQSQSEEILIILSRVMKTLNSL